MQPSRRWAVWMPGREPVEVTSGELFRVEVDGELQVRRMEYQTSLDADHFLLQVLKS